MNDFAAIASLLADADRALTAHRPVAALDPLRNAHPLLVERVASGSSLSAIVIVQAVFMSELAGDRALARAYAVLLVDEVGRELQRLGQLFVEQMRRLDHEAASRTDAVAYTYAVAFVPFVERARARNLLQATAPGSPEVAAVDGILQRVRPRLDALSWASWGYPAELENRARYWAAYALLRRAASIMDNRGSGNDTRLAQELAGSIEHLLVPIPQDQLGADYWNLVSRIYFDYGHSHFDQGLGALKTAARICKEIGNAADGARDDGNIAALEIDRAAFLRTQGDAAGASLLETSAEQHLVEARSTLLRERDYQGFIVATTNLLALYGKQRRWADAETAFREGWDQLPATGDQRVYLAPLLAGNFGSNLYDGDRIEEAERWLRAADKDVEAVRTRDPNVFQIVKGTLGRLLAASGRAEEGLAYLESAVGHIEGYRTSFLAERANGELIKRYRWIYEALIDCYVTLGAKDPRHWTAAYELAELIKWRAFTVVLRYLPLGLLDERDDPRAKIEAALLGQARIALGRPADATLRLPAIMEQLEAIWTEMETEHPHYVAFRRQRTTTFAETAALLDQQVPCLVEYYLGDQYDTAVAFVVKRGDQGPIAVRLPTTPSALEAQVEALRAADDTQPEEQFRAASRALHQSLLAPLLDHLPAGAGLCLVPYGPLHNLPFAALFDGDRYLIERHPLTTAPTASALRWWVEKDAGRTDACAIFTATSTVYSGDERQADLVLFEDLARKRLAPLFGKHKVISGPAATKASLLAEFSAPDDWGVIHIACHGEVGKAGEAHQGLTARLLMAGPPAAQKDLSSAEVFETIRSRAALVTLSACESAIAQTATNDELTGLAHAFLLAGASSVLATLSYVRQGPGVAITERFYQRWLGKSGEPAMSKIAALQEAQLAALRRRDWFGLGGATWHPQQWSAFALYGNWK